MKSLDEVIKAIEWCTELDQSGCGACPYSDNADNRCYEEDALHYLKEYQKLDSLDAVAFPEDDNPPLSWGELKQMEGKPVWVEILSDEIDLSSRWMMVARETKAHSLPLAYTDDMGHWIYGHEDDLGKTWQAYRKERG